MGSAPLLAHIVPRVELPPEKTARIKRLCGEQRDQSARMGNVNGKITNGGENLRNGLLASLSRARRPGAKKGLNKSPRLTRVDKQ